MDTDFEPDTPGEETFSPSPLKMLDGIEETNSDSMTKDPISWKVPVTGELLLTALGSKLFLKGWKVGGQIFISFTSDDDNYSFHD